MSDIHTYPREQAIANEFDFGTYDLPYLAEPDIDDVYERLLEAERRLASPTLLKPGYRDGVAALPDQLYVAGNANSRVVMTTEHATDHQREYLTKPGHRTKEAEWGVAGLARIIHEDTGAAHLSMLGRQTGDANNQLEHPLKVALRPLLALPRMAGHASLHGMARGKVSSEADERGYNFMLGIGPQPSDATKHVVDRLLDSAKIYDLRVGVNQATLQYERDNRTPRHLEDGRYKTIIFAAGKPVTVRSFSQATTEAAGKPDFAAVQIEMSGSMRFLPEDTPNHPGIKAQKMGIYLGYVFVRNCVKLMGQ